jgi:hypothetical protein
VGAFAALVAGQACLILGLRLCAAFFIEHNRGFRTFRNAGRPVDVGFTAAVAAGAGGSALVGNGAVFGLADGQHRIFFIDAMATCADSIALEDEILARGFFGVLCQRRLRHREKA